MRKAQEQHDAAIGRQRSDGHNNLGTALVALGDTAKAVEHYRIAVETAPGSPTANFNLGLTLADRGKLQDAQQYLEAAVKLAPELYEAHLKLAEVLIARGKAGDAAAHLRKAAQSPNPQVRNAATKLM